MYASYEAEQIVSNVLEILRSRSGFDHWFDQIDVETRLGIIEDLWEVVDGTIEDYQLNLEEDGSDY